MIILGIETSCDDTCVSVIEASGVLQQPRFKVLSNIISSQIKTHAPFGGVMPSLASREHAKNIAPVLKRTLRQSKTKLDNINLIAATTHPGLLPALIIGVESAKTLAWAKNKPIIGVNHLHGHIIANLLPNPKQKTEHKKIKFPAIGLIVSGGHTELVLIKSLNNIKIIGQTRDDAAGECFDKVGRLLGLPYPGGPRVARLAEKGDPDKFNLPRPMINSENLDFSFSGLKTAVLYLIQDLKNQKLQLPIADICASFQKAAVETLVFKTVAAAKKYNAKIVLLGGGVSANKSLRKAINDNIKNLNNVDFLMPPMPYTLDNAAMIAAAGYTKWLGLTLSQKKKADWKNIRAGT